MGFEERFSKVGRALDDAKEKVRGSIESSRGGEPLVNTERAKEGYTRLKQATHAKAEEAWEKYKSLPRFGAAAYALGALCAVLLIVVVVLMTSSPSTEKLPTRAKADEIATMAALRAKMSPNANGGSAGTNLASPKPR